MHTRESLQPRATRVVGYAGLLRCGWQWHVTMQIGSVPVAIQNHHIEFNEFQGLFLVKNSTSYTSNLCWIHEPVQVEVLYLILAVYLSSRII
jgi:hypothetical protein